MLPIMLIVKLMLVRNLSFGKQTEFNDCLIRVITLLMWFLSGNVVKYILMLDYWHY